ncbi:DEAD/DEAH box helicase [Paraprevotella clara]|jgi:replicative superfamily II helicase|uniref:DEAD/DEAH box helicase n=2 Tax=Paraprevotella clara TaxID=454154 RepID=UPI000E5388A1|nr:DEAD/DEAH box helicase [Paraprevotella clara]RGU56063.1 helicase [Paraprevotella clara]
MNRIKQILKGESIENLLDETILRIFGEGLIMSSDSEILSLIKLYYPNLFASRENKLLHYQALFYKTLPEPSTVKEQIFKIYQDVIFENFHHGYTPIQVDIANGISNNQIFSFSAPTSTGKSFVIMNLIKECDSDVVVIVPSRALINEYYARLCELIPEKSVNILTFIEHINTAHANKNVFIVTPERCREIFKFSNIFKVGLFLFDEAQLSNEDNQRGMFFDSIVRRCNVKFPKAKLIFAQPFVCNPESQIARNKLTERQSSSKNYRQQNVGQLYLAYNDSKFYHYGIDKAVMGNRKEECSFDPIMRCIESGGSILFYVSKSKILSRGFHDEFNEYISKCEKISDENALILIEKIQKYTGGKTTKNQNYYSLFIDLLSYGIVVHHGSMPLEARLLVEEFTRKGFCKICFATSTLEQGINMPFDIVFIDRLESSDPLGVKNLIGRAGRSSVDPNFDYGSIVIRTSAMSRFRQLMTTPITLKSTSMLDVEHIDDIDLNEIKQELNEGTYDDSFNLPQSKLEILSDDESNQIIRQLLDYLFVNQKFISSNTITNGDRWSKLVSLFDSFYAHYVKRELSQGERGVLHTAIRILVWRVEAKTFKNMCQLRYQYVSRAKERALYKRRNVENRLEAKFTARYQEIPNKNCHSLPLVDRGILARDVDYDTIIYDTYDYLDKFIGFKLSDILYAAFYKYFLQNGDDRALTAANYIKYGTNDNQEIWLLKYGVMFEDMTILKPHITSINQNELIVNQTFYQLPEDKRRAVERFVN